MGLIFYYVNMDIIAQIIVDDYYKNIKIRKRIFI